MNQIDIVESSGNVFADLGLDHPEILLGKAEMVRLIASASESRGYTEADLAQALDADLVTVADLLRGKLGRFGRETDLVSERAGFRRGDLDSVERGGRCGEPTGVDGLSAFPRLRRPLRRP
jgi:predicted XRE-type DNA-binding protein